MIGGISLETEEVKSIILNFTLDVQRQIPFNFQKKKKRIIVISGPTWCGKSKLAMELSQAIGGEIVFADSMQVYRHIDIGTTKATLYNKKL